MTDMDTEAEERRGTPEMRQRQDTLAELRKRLELRTKARINTEEIFSSNRIPYLIVEDEGVRGGRLGAGIIFSFITNNCESEVEENKAGVELAKAFCRGFQQLELDQTGDPKKDEAVRRSVAVLNGGSVFISIDTMTAFLDKLHAQKESGQTTAIADFVNKSNFPEFVVGRALAGGDKKKDE